MSAQTLEALEERVAAVETRLEQLEKAEEANKPDKANEADKSDEVIPWWKKIVGIHADTPGFDEALRLGREWRESQDSFDTDGSA